MICFRSIGHGAFGKVCEGVLHAETTSLHVAVKVHLPTCIDDDDDDDVQWFNV